MKLPQSIHLPEDPVGGGHLHPSVNEKYWSLHSRSSLTAETLDALFQGLPSTPPWPLPICPHQLELYHQLLFLEVSHPFVWGKDSTVIDHHGPRHIPPGVFSLDFVTTLRKK